LLVEEGLAEARTWRTAWSGGWRGRWFWESIFCMFERLLARVSKFLGYINYPLPPLSDLGDDAQP